MVEGVYECPYCGEMALEMVYYGEDEVYECFECGAEIWHWQKYGIKETCRQIKSENFINIWWEKNANKKDQ